MTSRDPFDHFTEELHAWAERPTPSSPRVARARVLQALTRPRWSLNLRLAAAAALLAGALIVTMVVVGPGLTPTPQVEEARLRQEPGKAATTMVFELESGTLLYLTLGPNTNGG